MLAAGSDIGSTINNMRVVAKVWGFIFGVAVIAGAPLIVFALAGFLARYVFNGSYHYPKSDPMFWVTLAFSLCGGCGAPVLSLCLACRWRKQHRLLPISFFSLEVTLGVAAALLYFFMQMGLSLN